MSQKIKALYTKYREAVIYIIFGVLTTAVDFVTYILLTRLNVFDENVSNVISQAAAILFAFVTNKIFVFNDKTNGIKELTLQLFKFVSLRLITLGLNSILFYFMIDMLKINDIITKALVSVIVIILNYVFSKLIVFTKKKEGSL